MYESESSVCWLVTVHSILAIATIFTLHRSHILKLRIASLLTSISILYSTSHHAIHRTMFHSHDSGSWQVTMSAKNEYKAI